MKTELMKIVTGSVQAQSISCGHQLLLSGLEIAKTNSPEDLHNACVSARGRTHYYNNASAGILHLVIAILRG